jgi:hypothetical protein
MTIVAPATPATRAAGAGRAVVGAGRPVVDVVGVAEVDVGAVVTVMETAMDVLDGAACAAWRVRGDDPDEHAARTSAKSTAPARRPRMRTASR